MREIHIAGPLVNWVQRCSRCGEMLSDYRYAMVPEGDPMPRGWSFGARVEVERGAPTQWWVTDDAPTCDEQLSDSIAEHGLL